MKALSLLSGLTLLILIQAATSALAQAPPLMTYQGRLADELGQPLDTVVDMSFLIFADEAGTELLWGEQIGSIPVNDGLFEVILGEIVSLDSVFDGNVRFLEVVIADITGPRQTELLPILSTPYAMRSNTTGLAESVMSGSIGSEELREGAIGPQHIWADSVEEGSVLKYTEGMWVFAPDEIGSGPTLPYFAEIDVSGSAFEITNTNSSGSGKALAGYSSSGDGVVGWTGAFDRSGLYGFTELGHGVTGRSTAGGTGVYGETSGEDSLRAGVHGHSSGLAPGVRAFGQSVGLRASSAPGGLAARMTGDVEIGGRLDGYNPSGVAGFFSAGTVGEDTGVVKIRYNGPMQHLYTSGVYSDCRTSNGMGIGGVFRGGYKALVANLDLTGSGYYEAIYAHTTIAPGADGVGVGLRGKVEGGPLADGTGVTGESVGCKYNFGVKGYGSGIVGAANECTYGVIGSGSYARHNYGVYGSAWSSIDGEDAFGVQGLSDGLGSVCYGIFGSAGGDSTNYGGYFTAVFGYDNIGIYAATGDSGNGDQLAGLFVGDVQVNGHVYADNITSRIDHPLDPENHYLQHSALEAPDLKVVYDGSVTLDASGRAVVALPDYFQALAGNFCYQLTAVGAPAPGLYIAEEIANNRFVIAGGSAGMKVCWQVTGIRHDPSAQTEEYMTKLPKGTRERGLYLQPEAYGFDRSRSVSARHITSPELYAPGAENAPVPGSKNKSGNEH